MNLDARKRRLLTLALASGSLGLGVLTAGFFAARWAVHYKAPCSQPCQDLGPVPKEDRIPDLDFKQPFDSPANKRVFQLRELPPPKLKCDPLKLDLELAKPETRVGKRYTLWYKISLKNVSCYEFHIKATSFAGTLDRSMLPHEFRIWDPAGNKVENRRFSGGPTEYGAVLPYRDDWAAWRRLRADPELETDENGYIKFKPGKTITTSSPILDPQIAGPYIDVVTHEGGETQIGTAPTYKKVTLKDAPPPPPGFSILDEFEFEKPGIYSIQVVFDHPHLSAKPVYPYADRTRRHIPGFVFTLLSFSRIFGIELHDQLYPRERHGSDYHIRAESKILSFEVKP